MRSDNIGEKYMGVVDMFEGFDEKTSEFFFRMTLNNSKAYLQENIETYNSYVKHPLRELHSELSRIVLDIDSNICIMPGRCISGIYNDVRFGNKDTPLRNYMWVRFKCMCSRETDIPGFFFDASYDGFRYGMRIYKMTSGGMGKIRAAILKDARGFKKLSGRLDEDGVFENCGKEYVKDHYPEQEPSLKKWLNKKEFFIHRTQAAKGKYYSHELVDELSAGYRSLADIYLFIKRALAD